MDLLHDFFKGIVPFALCLRKLISEKTLTLDQLNNIIELFPYDHTDKVNKPQKNPKKFASDKKKSTGGNGHKNWTLLRLLPFKTGSLVPEEEEKAWR